MATRLGIYNGALRLLGETRLSSLTESRAARRELDAVWDNGFIDYCLEAGLWNFAMRSTRREVEADITPGFGFTNAFAKPDDFIRTAKVCSDEYFNVPLLAYTDEAEYWFSDADPLYVAYVSNDSEYGGNLAIWPETFAHFAEAHLAYQACMPIKQSNDAQERCLVIRKQTLRDALAKDAMAEPTKMLPRGGWASARAGGSSNRSRWNGR